MTTALFKGTLHHQKDKTATPVEVRLLPGAVALYAEGDATKPLHEWLVDDIASARLLGDGSVIVQNGPLFLDVREKGFDAALERALGGKKLFRRSFFDRIGIAGCILALALAVVPLPAAYYWLAPYAADRAAQQVSLETEKQIGDALFSAMTAAYEFDTAGSRAVQQFYDALQYGGNYPIRISVVRQPVVNAFALPGGHIVVFDSILHMTDAPEQLAALLAHEASHVQMKHSTRALFRQMTVGVLIGMVWGDYGDLSSVIAQQGVKLAGLSYSRQLEFEADDRGLALMEQAGIPLRGMPDLFSKMQAQSRGETTATTPDFLSTHPSMDERIQRANSKIAAKSDAPTVVSDSIQALWEKIRQKR